MASSPRYLLDASAVLTLTGPEAGAEQVHALLDESAIHAVNLAEVVRKLVLKGVSPDEAEETIRDLNIPVITELTVEQAYMIGRWTPDTRRAGLSLADCICLTTAELLGATAVTTDRQWSVVAGDRVRVLQVRPEN